ncbi:hypothetical protein [Caenibacillus caldisaponilyticus]|jgi:hypothetical protein|uniref:hypothetical protein n=1 Tax=Caenibacillus caldisaponilyticus TaxID=1674942 RepID=UPI0009884AC7|nr:hypothetical protein [Caenibacillus caldisaponilyticus]
MGEKRYGRYDSLSDGRDQYYLDVDRMINEGLAGGTVDPDVARSSVDQAREIVRPESKPTTSH